MPDKNEPTDFAKLSQEVIDELTAIKKELKKILDVLPEKPYDQS